jgi:cation-transporting ATPase E
VSIVRANVLTVFNVILVGFGAATLIFGDARDALFLALAVANVGIGVTAEVRAKRAWTGSRCWSRRTPASRATDR